MFTVKNITAAQPIPRNTLPAMRKPMVVKAGMPIERVPVVACSNPDLVSGRVKYNKAKSAANPPTRRSIPQVPIPGTAAEDL